MCDKSVNTGKGYQIQVVFIRKWVIRKQCSVAQQIKKVQYWISDNAER